jgi:hypothetical protein
LLSGVSTPNGQKLRQRGGSNSAHVREPGDTWALMYQPDAVACLSRLAGVLAPGGIIVLQEHDSTSMPICRPSMPLHERVSGWLWETVAHEGANVHMGLHLAPTLARAEFTIEGARATATLLTPDQPSTIATIVRAMAERMVEAHVTSLDDIAIDFTRRPAGRRTAQVA